MECSRSTFVFVFLNQSRLQRGVCSPLTEALDQKIIERFHDFAFEASGAHKFVERSSINRFAFMKTDANAVSTKW